jgi:hypothetical protein
VTGVRTREPTIGRATRATRLRIGTARRIKRPVEPRKTAEEFGVLFLRDQASSLHQSICSRAVLFLVFMMPPWSVKYCHSCQRRSIRITARPPHYSTGALLSSGEVVPRSHRTPARCHSTGSVFRAWSAVCPRNAPPVPTGWCSTLPQTSPPVVIIDNRHRGSVPVSR